METGIEPTQRRPLGRTGLTVTRLGFGTTTLGGLFRSVSDADADAAVKAAWAAGMRFFDTAPQYGNGLAELRLGAALRRMPRADYVLSSKVGKLLTPLRTGSAESHLFADLLPFELTFDYGYDATLRSLDMSLARLGTNRIDLLLIHDIIRRYHGEAVEARYRDAMTGAHKALVRLREEKVISGFGTGSADLDIVCRFVREGDLDCLVLPGRYTLLDQSALDELLPLCLERGIAVILAAPFESGILATGAVEGARFVYREPPAEIIARTRAIESVCIRFGVPLAAAALQFPLTHPAIVSVLAGMRSADEVAANLALMRTPVPGELWTALQREGFLHEGVLPTA